MFLISDLLAELDDLDRFDKKAAIGHWDGG